MITPVCFIPPYVARRADTLRWIKGVTICDDTGRGLRQIVRMKWIDIPPVLFAAFAVGAYFLGLYDPLGLSFGDGVAGGLADFFAGLLIGAGLVLMLLAVTEMRRQKTTIVPHREADRLVQSGIFKRSRNPIYLGDTLILAGLIFRFDAPIALPLVPIFLWIIERHFVLPEEDRLRRKFRADFARYCEKTRSWI